ncbi:cingulin isoform X2 [Sardina pilchardus]|uniref:cingulin isoform X2 n=1 Tax=Sardina pilchardus TaxID=27697 RepID=UPI002E102B93
MSSLSADRKPPLDYGVQIRFIKDLDDTGGGYGERGRANGGRANGGRANGAGAGTGGGGAGAAVTPPSSRYGVAVRVQGISGQPYVVLKDGEKGDSYGVQLKSHPQALSPVPPGSGGGGGGGGGGSLSSRSSPLPSLPSISSPRPSPDPRSLSATPSSPEEEPVGRFGSPSRRPPGDGQAVGQGEALEERTMETPLRPAASAPRRPPAVTNGVESKSLEGLTEGGLKKVGLKGIGREDQDSFPEPPPPVAFEEEPVQAIDTKSLAPINKLISRFNATEPASTPPATTASGASQTQPRGRSGARVRLRFDERRRSRSLDSRKDLDEDSRPRKSPSPTFNPYGPSLVSSSSSSSLASNPPYNSLGRKSATVAKATPVSAPKPVPFSQPRKPPVIPKKPMTPDLLRNRTHSLELTNGEELDSKQTILSILKEGSTESEASLKRKAALIQERLGGVKSSSTEAELENERLKQQLEQSQKDLQQANKQLAAARREQEGAESRLQQQEDQLAQLQEELRGVSENTPHTETLQTELVSVQAELSDAAMQRQRLEESLRQRERELTALKGALKDEVASHDREMEALKEQYSQDLDTLRQSMENVSQTQQEMEDERERVNSSVMALEEELEGSVAKEQHWRTQLHSTSQELHKVQEEKKEMEERLKQMSVSEEKSTLLQELQSCRGDLKRVEAELDQQRAESARKEEELRATRTTSEEREEKLKAEIDSWKEQSQKNLEELEKALEKAKQTPVSSSPDLGASLELQEANTRLRERLARMSRLHSTSGGGSSEAEQALEEENRSLRGQLEEARRGASRAGQERDELSRRLEEREREREVLRRGKSDLEEQKRLLDRALEKINKEMELMMGDSRQSVQTLQSQLDEFRDRSRRDLQDAQRLSKDRLTELQRAQASNKSLQEEVSRLKRELLTSAEERDSAQLDRDVMAGRLKHLESELESEKGSHSDRGREIRSLEDKVKSLGIELDEEKTGTELLNDRIARSREQVDQLRADLMQERSARHDLEMDKSAIERQVKELKSRVADMEGQSRPSAGHALLEAKVQEQEERLRSEEREKASIQASQRRMERKLKEVNATLDQERHIHAEQRDQLLLRVKALKRQMDESEGEVERLENVRRKILRELEEQQELHEALKTKVTTLEGELKRKGQQSRRPTLGTSTLSSDEEDGYYDNNSISSILTESQLQTTNC